METINLTIEELDQIKAIQENYTQLTTAFGQIEIAQENLTSQKEGLKKALLKINSPEISGAPALPSATKFPVRFPSASVIWPIEKA